MSNILLKNYLEIKSHPLTLQEFELAREEVSNKILEVSDSNIILINISGEAIKLTKTYIIEGALTNKVTKMATKVKAIFFIIIFLIILLTIMKLQKQIYLK